MTDITITHNNIEISGYLSEPEETPTAGIIVIQEWWGLTEDIKEMNDVYEKFPEVAKRMKNQLQSIIDNGYTRK